MQRCFCFVLNGEEALNLASPCLQFEAVQFRQLKWQACHISDSTQCTEASATDEAESNADLQESVLEMLSKGQLEEILYNLQAIQWKIT